MKLNSHITQADHALTGMVDIVLGMLMGLMDIGAATLILIAVFFTATIAYCTQTDISALTLIGDVLRGIR